MDYEEFLKEKYNKVSLTHKELAEEIGISPRLVQEHARDCKAEIPSFRKVGRTLIFPIKEVAKWLTENLIKVG